MEKDVVLLFVEKRETERRFIPILTAGRGMWRHWRKSQNIALQRVVTAIKKPPIGRLSV